MSITCCLAPDPSVRHAAYCITRAPAATGAFGPGTFGSWSDEHVMRMMHRQADTCVEVMAMPEAERRTPGPKGGASPEQAATFNAMLAMRLQAEARQRGLISPE